MTGYRLEYHDGVEWRVWSTYFPMSALGMTAAERVAQAEAMIEHVYRDTRIVEVTA